MFVKEIVFEENKMQTLSQLPFPSLQKFFLPPFLPIEFERKDGHEGKKKNFFSSVDLAIVLYTECTVYRESLRIQKREKKFFYHAKNRFSLWMQILKEAKVDTADLEKCKEKKRCDDKIHPSMDPFRRWNKI